MERRVPDISKAREWFGYIPTHSLADILSSVIDYYIAKAVADKASSLPFAQPTISESAAAVSATL